MTFRETPFEVDDAFLTWLGGPEADQLRRARDAGTLNVTHHVCDITRRVALNVVGLSGSPTGGRWSRQLYTDQPTLVFDRVLDSVLDPAVNTKLFAPIE